MPVCLSTPIVHWAIVLGLRLWIALGLWVSLGSSVGLGLWGRLGLWAALLAVRFAVRFVHSCPFSHGFFSMQLLDSL